MFFDTFFETILTLKSKMASEHGKSFSIRSVMSNLVGKAASFVFVGHLVQEIPPFLVFNMALAAILDLKVKIVPNITAIILLNLAVPKLVGNDTLYAPLAKLVQDIISLFIVFNMALAAILNNGLLKYFPTTFGRCMGGLLFFK